MQSDGAIFKKGCGGYNFLTPYVQGYYRNGNIECEVSEGRDFNGAPMFGVTVVQRNGVSYDRRTDLNKLFQKPETIMDAIEYAESIKAD